MNNNVKYSFTTNSEGVLVFQSQVNSFGLDHVTEKDIRSFYAKFSESAYFDTGLLPVDGSGILSIRTAGPHTQIGYQHKPGMYYINWGAYEGDPYAANIYVAQPYRVVIADLYNDNILGARTFYSPIPIQHPDTPLYHVNLPNINCRGYRGNGVGWICLYHKEDISTYPFSEKLAKILERCSGVEAYNDANMSETDGPRFYRDNNKPLHITDPKAWEKYSEENGVEWTLDPDLWIPVLVKDIDNQDKHDSEGIPLTYANAILGDYQAYYTDSIRPKPVNAIVRNLESFDHNTVFNWFKVSYNSSQEVNQPKKVQDPFSSSSQVRITLSETITKGPTLTSFESDEQEDDESMYLCDCCNDVTFSTDTDNYVALYNGEMYCIACAEEETVWVDHISAHVHQEDDDLGYLDHLERYVYLPIWNQTLTCINCSGMHAFDLSSGYGPDMVPIYKHKFDENVTVCTSCASMNVCPSCKSMRIPKYDQENYQIPEVINPDTFKKQKVCNHCYNKVISSTYKCLDLTPETSLTCICGKTAEASQFIDVKPTDISFETACKLKSLSVTYDNYPDLFNLITKNNKIVNYSESYSVNIDKTTDGYKNEHFSNVAENPHYFVYSISAKKLCPGCSYSIFIEEFSLDIRESLKNILSNEDYLNILQSEQSQGKLTDLSIYCHSVF